MYWLKVIGWDDLAMYNGLVLDQPVYPIEFSSRPGKPSIAQGDTIIVYGKTVINILYIATPIDQPVYIQANEWPWTISVNNLTTYFGAVWQNYGLNPYDLVNVFHQQNPGVPVTYQGAQNLDAMRYRRDRIKLSEQFGQFLYDTVMLIENNLQTAALG
jgi:hypothetical protein